MKTSRSSEKAAFVPGLTFIELAIVIFVLLLFLGMAFLGVNVWKDGSDRANCVLNIRHVQQAVRGIANSYGLVPGDNTMSHSPPMVLAGELIGPGRYFPNAPECPGNGVYTLGGNMVPMVGELYMTCSLAASMKHVPDYFDRW